LAALNNNPRQKRKRLNMHANIQNLREISESCLSGEALSPDQARWLGDALARFLEHECRSIDDAFGLRLSRGGMPWWREEANRKRDSALRRLARTYFGDLSPSAQATHIATLSTRYAASAWRHDRACDDMPDAYRRTPKELLWTAFASRATMPLGHRQLRHILGRA
jgi:hypothetical protein